MKAEDLKNSILQLAMEGKLVPQDPNDEPASVLLEKIREEKEKLIKEKKIKRNNKESFIFRKNGHFYEMIGNKGEPVCIDDEIPFEIPDSWECVRMGTFNEIARGGSPRPIKQYITEDPNGINWIKIGDTIKGDKYIYSTKEKIKPKGIKKSRYVEEGDFLLTNSMSFGRPYILKTDGCIHDGWLVIKLNDDLFYQDYMFYLLSSNIVFEQFSKLSAGSTVKNLKIDSVKKVLIPIPPLNEQKSIVDKIEKILPLIEEYGKYKEHLNKINLELPNKLKDSILQEAIQGKLVPQDPDDEPSSVLLEKIRHEKERLIKEKKIKRNKNESYIFKENNHFYEKIGEEVIDITKELPFKIPENWIWCKLENITSNIHYGYTASAQEVGDVKLLRITDIHENKVNWDSVPYCNIAEDKLENYILRNRDIVMARTGGTIGKSYIINNLNKQAVFASYLIRIIPLKNINENYLKQFFESHLFWSQLKDNTKGTGQPNINAKSLKSLIIPIPPFIEQDIIVNKIEKIFNEINLRLKV